MYPTLSSDIRFANMLGQPGGTAGQCTHGFTVTHEHVDVTCKPKAVPLTEVDQLLSVVYLKPTTNSVPLYPTGIVVLVYLVVMVFAVQAPLLWIYSNSMWKT